MKITINEGTSFLITDELGDINRGTKHGLYEQDTRFLSSYHLLIDKRKPTLLSSKSVDHYSALHYLTNPPIAQVSAATLSIIRQRFIGKGLHEDIDVLNHNLHPVSFTLQFDFSSDFADIFEIKTESLNKTGTYLVKMGEDGGSLSLNYSREDFIRKLVIKFSRPPRYSEEKAIFDLYLKPGEKWHLCIDFLTLTAQEEKGPKYSCSAFKKGTAEEALQLERWLAQSPTIISNYHIIEHVYQQSLIDLESLVLREEGLPEEELVLAAGVPWFMTFFGRDTLITSYQSLLVNSDLAKGALRSLAKYQGSKVDSYTQEEPGKILHEIRFGELKAFREIPHVPYYGTIDATPLFLILLSEVLRWTDDINFIKELRDEALKALDWIDSYGDRDGDGYLEYHREGKKGLVNQGWKDSGDSIRFSDGSMATSPVALCEVQGYVYDAKVRMAELFEVIEEKERARKLKREAENLKVQFNKDFWLEEKGYFALALDKNKNKVDSLTSNIGHLLWSGIADKGKAELVAKRLMSQEMFSGWGIRTMSSKDKGYNPLSYHNGSVWPHDNSLIACGLAKYGFYEEAKRVISALIEASSYFPKWRLPELFCGYSRGEPSYPVDYPSSCSPQAWASGAIILFLTTILGFGVDVPKKRIQVKPVLPFSIENLRIDGIRIGDEKLTFELNRKDTKAEVKVIKVPKGLELILDP